MRNAVIFSGLFHMAIITLAYFGLPSLFRPAPSENVPIPVEVVTIAEFTNPPPPAPPPEPPKPEAEKPPSPPEPEPPKVAAVSPPPQPKPQPKPESVPPPQVAKAEPRIKAKPKRKPEPPPRDPMASVLKTVEELKHQAPKNEEKPPPRDPMASVLKTVEELKHQAPKDEEKPPATVGTAQPAPRYTPDEPPTINLIDLVKRQIQECWSLPAGAKEAENLVVDIQVALDPDGTVRQVRIVDAARMEQDSFFRAAAESARRAVLKCSPLKLPPETYQQWKTMTLTFDPKEMFGL